MSVSVLVAAFGDHYWWQLACDRAVPSAKDQNAHEIIDIYEEQGTIASSRNAAAGMATGDWLCFLDADDELGCGYIAAMEVAIEREGADDSRHLLLTPAVSHTRSNKRRCAIFLPEKPLSDNNWLVIGTLIRRDLFWKIGGFLEEDPHGLEDWSLWTRAAAAGAQVVKVPDAVYVAHTRRLSSHALYARNPEYGREYTRIRRAAWPELYEC